MLRITIITQSETETLLKVDGWIAGKAVALLEEEGIRWRQQGKRLVLDLEGVQFIDEEGIALLRGWPAEKLTLRGGSMYVRMLLKGRGLIQGSDPSSQSGPDLR